MFITKYLFCQLIDFVTCSLCSIMLSYFLVPWKFLLSKSKGWWGQPIDFVLIWPLCIHYMHLFVRHRYLKNITTIDLCDSLNVQLKGSMASIIFSTAVRMTVPNGLLRPRTNDVTYIINWCMYISCWNELLDYNSLLAHYRSEIVNILDHHFSTKHKEVKLKVHMSLYGR